MKTPEELAEVYAASISYWQELAELRCPDWCSDDVKLVCDDPKVRSLVSDAFLAGYDAAEPKWISVRERLPEKFRSVALVDIASWENGPVDRNIYSIGYLNKCCSANYWSTNDSRGQAINAFTHWMPLPKPPEEEK